MSETPPFSGVRRGAYEEELSEELLLLEKDGPKDYPDGLGG